IVIKHINHLVADGWLRKDVATNDRRKNELFLTQKGRDLLPVLDKIMEDISHERVAGLTDNDAETLEKLLEKAAKTYDV
ncbi:hypothetical protein, partial [Campylobacter sp. 2018MI27]|uniref:MarR family winged helix-turn-helix transcriptional regulator n=1 Tax=Campylobacter sp. 2018MI27 TaxID=2836738 RepID=UPI001BDB3BF4